MVAVAPAPQHVGGSQTSGARWRYLRAADGTRLAWRLDGRGEGVPVVLLNGIACSDAYWPVLADVLGAARPVLRHDYRGHGRSEAPLDRDAVDVGTLVADLCLVLDAAAVGAAVLVGHSFGVQVALETARRHPDRVAGVVALAGAGGHPLPPLVDRARRAATSLARRRPEVAQQWWQRVWGGEEIYWASRLIGGASRLTPAETLGEYFAHVRHMDMPTLSRMFAHMQEHDASDVVADLSVPLLAVAGGRDRLTPLAVMRDLALRAPDGTLVVVPAAAHTLPADDPGAVAAALHPFLVRVDEQQWTRHDAARAR